MPCLQVHFHLTSLSSISPSRPFQPHPQVPVPPPPSCHQFFRPSPTGQPGDVIVVLQFLNESLLGGGATFPGRVCSRNFKNRADVFFLGVDSGSSNITQRKYESPRQQTSPKISGTKNGCTHLYKLYVRLM